MPVPDTYAVSAVSPGSSDWILLAGVIGLVMLVVAIALWTQREGRRSVRAPSPRRRVKKRRRFGTLAKFPGPIARRWRRRGQKTRWETGVRHGHVISLNQRLSTKKGAS